MAKSKTVFYCTQCGYESNGWLGRCPGCGEWNSFVEEPAEKKSSSKSGGIPAIAGIGGTRPLKIDEIDCGSEGVRDSSGIGELDRVMGGGIVRGSMVLVAGDPGIGKSTLMLMISGHLALSAGRVLYVSGEESERQIKMRAQRLGGDSSHCSILSETILENILEQAAAVAPDLLVVDSIQTIYSDALDSSAGSVSQVRECAARLLRYAKESGTPVILIGHITKDGTIAGPKVLEHIVDVVLQFEGDTRGAYRLLRSIKNRFGSTSELAVFEMTGEGLRQVLNPSEILIPMHQDDLSGIAIASVMDGTRPFMLEIQALVSTAAYGMPQRNANGFDARRMNMLLAVLEKRAGFKLAAKDVFLNVAGGLRVTDPACDMAVAVAILASNFDLSVPLTSCFCAEIGLSGELRPVSQVQRRIAEAKKIGFKKIYISSFNKEGSFSETGIEVVPVADIPALCRLVFK